MSSNIFIAVLVISLSLFINTNHQNESSAYSLLTQKLSFLTDFPTLLPSLYIVWGLPIENSAVGISSPCV